MLSPDDGTILFYTIKAPEKHNISYEEGVPDARQVLHHRLADSSISSQSFDLVSGTSDSNADLYAVSSSGLLKELRSDGLHPHIATHATPPPMLQYITAHIAPPSAPQHHRVTIHTQSVKYTANTFFA